MTLLSTYDPSSEAFCPKCKEQVHCDNIGGMTFGMDPYLDFYHKKCGTEWRHHIRSQEVEHPIPKPMTLREMMGEDNWHDMKFRERAQSVALEMLEALEAIISGADNGLEKAKTVVAKVKGPMKKE